MAILNKDEIEQVRLDLLTKLGKRIKQLREDKNLSQVALVAKIMGEIDTTNISRIESGRVNPTIFTLFRIAEALEIPLSAIVSIDKE